MLSDTTLSALLASLVDEIAEAVAERLADRLPAQASRQELLDGPAMAELIGVSLQTLERHRKSGQIPSVSIGRRVLYSPSAVIAALSEPASAQARP